jgi:TrmH family RNA methyltransferase
VQRLRRLVADRRERDDAGLVVCEGRRLLLEAIAAGLEVEETFVAVGEPLDGPLTGASIVADGVVERVSSTTTAQPVIAVVRRPASDESRLESARFVLVADRVGDPGNLGTLLRSAEAAGADALVLTTGTVDPWSPKVVRASAGAVFRIPVVVASLPRVRAAGLRTIGTSSHVAAARPYDEVDVSGRIAIVVGNEAHGLDDDADVDEWVTIPHRGSAESLNVAMAATVMMFEALRRRGEDE